MATTTTSKKKASAKKTKTKTKTKASRARKTSAKGSTLDEALAALEAGDREAALSSLLDAWRAARVPAIADVIDTLGKSLAENYPPIVAVGSKSQKAAWFEAEKDPRAGIFNRILETAATGTDRYFRMAALNDRAADPRVTAFATNWMLVPPISGAGRRSYFGRVVELITKVSDVRMVPALQSMIEDRGLTVHRIGIPNWKTLVAFTEQLAAQTPRALSASEAALLAKVTTLISASRTPAATAGSSASDPKSFFDKVYANPDDDEARAVLGDLLQQRGDPRGEFIAMQLARYGTDKPRTAAEHKLEETWGRKWLGAIEPCVLKKGVVFERGFVARCHFSGGFAGEKAAAAEEWSTVTHVDTGTASGFVMGSHQMLMSAAARRSMRHVTGLASADLTALMEGEGSLPWVTLGARLWSGERQIMENGPGKIFANVTKLVFDAPWTRSVEATDEQVAALIAKWTNVDTFEVAVSPARLVTLATNKSLERLTRLCVNAETLRLDLSFRTKELRVVFNTVRDEPAADVASVLTAFAKTALVEKVHVSVNGRAKLENGTVTRGRYEEMSTQAIVSAAKSAGITLEIDIQ